MSYVLVDQDWETDTSPFSTTGTIGRSSTSPLVGSWSLLGGDGTAKDGQVTLPSAPALVQTGSRKALAIWFHTRFKIDTAPSGGNINIIELRGTNPGDRWVLYIPGGATRMDAAGASITGLADVTTTGSTSLGTTAHDIDVIYREEKADGVFAEVFLDGTLEITHRVATRAIDHLRQVFMGVGAAGKCTWQAKWDTTKLWVGHDPS